MPSKLHRFKSDPAGQGRGAGFFYRRSDISSKYKGWQKYSANIDGRNKPTTRSKLVYTGKVGRGDYKHRHDSPPATKAELKKGGIPTKMRKGHNVGKTRTKKTRAKRK